MLNKLLKYDIVSLIFSKFQKHINNKGSTCHLILGRPWQYDVDATHRCQDNVYVFFKNDRKINLGPIKDSSLPKASKVEGKPSFLIVNNEDEFDKECREMKQVYVVVVTDGELKKVVEVLEAIQPLIKELEEHFP